MYETGLDLKEEGAEEGSRAVRELRSQQQTGSGFQAVFPAIMLEGRGFSCLWRL